ncbi:MAG: Crp/Fnr family transcriptional regulator [Bacteroidia bacterium]|nr:Crp/Fnr family transcriptional regulator [Bacteroidia bacterium]MCZ2141150.1 Crp/Fnr family transcriptional regulator [Bacteroidia bacterium]
MDKKIELINQLFPHFEDGLKQQLASHAIVKTFKANDMVMESGQYLKWTVLVTSGRIKIYTTGEEGEEYFMYFIEPGQACAMSFICAARNKKSELEAIAAEDTEALLIPLEILDKLMQSYKSWYYFVLENYRARFQELLDTMRSVAFHKMDERLEYYLIKQKNATSNNELQLTHEQIANDLNTSRVVISRLLKQMENNKKVKLHRNAIVLL